MWMMGYSEGGEINSIQDPFTGRKLRPLVPRTATATAAAAAASINPHCLTRLHGTDLLTLNHHLATMAEQNKRELTTQQVVVSSRWNPTPEQLQTLEELYRRGTRTPSAEQIQHITAQLRRHGKIEGKNVFYWFQNHKARERQKRRRQIESISDERQPENNRAEKEEPRGGNRSAFEVEQTKNWASPTNPSTLAEMSGQVEAECKEAIDGWVQFDDDAELQRRRNATWRTMSMSCSSSPTSNLINPSAPTVTSAAVPSSLGGTTQIKPLNVFLEPYNDPLHLDHHTHGGAEAAQTLQLFPLRSGCCRRNEGGDDEEESGAAMNTVAPFQFFEFLPLKN